MGSIRCKECYIFGIDYPQHSSHRSDYGFKFTTAFDSFTGVFLTSRFPHRRGIEVRSMCLCGCRDKEWMDGRDDSLLP